MKFNKNNRLIASSIIIILIILSFLGLWLNHRNSFLDNGETTLADKRAQIGKSHLRGRYNAKVEEFEQLPNIENLIIFLGDSITRAGKWSELLAEETEKPIYNLGISADTTDGVLQRLDQVIDFEPNQLFLLIGINDFGSEAKTPEEVIVNYRLILDKLSSNIPETKIYVQSILPVNNRKFSFRADNQDLMVVNQVLKELALEYNYQYIDLYSQFINVENQLSLEYTDDGLHLNSQGYSLWTNILVDYLK